jgi:hypothetical protein
MVTRDSYVWWLTLVAAIVGYLITAEKPPTEWSYLQWLQAASFVLAWLAGKLSTSPLAISDKGRDSYLYPQ